MRNANNSFLLFQVIDKKKRKSPPESGLFFEGSGQELN
tara:strand:+ start:2265 stop:2378 length:114 start_codon:yes stop_codon:yes gene_type:complete